MIARVSAGLERAKMRSKTKAGRDGLDGVDEERWTVGANKGPCHHPINLLIGATGTKIATVLKHAKIWQQSSMQASGSIACTSKAW